MSEDEIVKLNKIIRMYGWKITTNGDDLLIKYSKYSDFDTGFWCKSDEYIPDRLFVFWRDYIESIKYEIYNDQKVKLNNMIYDFNGMSYKFDYLGLFKEYVPISISEYDNESSYKNEPHPPVY